MARVDEDNCRQEEHQQGRQHRARVDAAHARVGGRGASHIPLQLADFKILHATDRPVRVRRASKLRRRVPAGHVVQNIRPPGMLLPTLPHNGW